MEDAGKQRPQNPNPLVMRARQKINPNPRATPKLLAHVLAQAHTQLLGLALYLNTRVNRYSLKARRRLLVLFCLVFVSVNLHTLVRGIAARDKLMFAVSPIRIVPLQRPGTRLQVISGAELSRIHGWERNLDRLLREGKRTRLVDSFFKARPHLLDTLRFLENFYTKKQNSAYEK